MRRTAVIPMSILAWVALSPGCTGKLLLPAPVASDGGFAIDTAVELGTGGSGPMGGMGGISASGGTSGQGGHGGAARVCHVKPALGFSRPKASLLLSVGRNASMSTSFGSFGGTRISEVQQKLHDGVMANRNAINFGYQDFPGASCSNASGCCANSDAVGPGSPQAVLQRLQCDVGSGNTCVSTLAARPIADALKSARNLLGTDSFRERDLVLIVDGDPSCASETASDSCDSAKNHLSNLNIDEKKTYVVAVGIDVTTPCLQMIASQGNTTPPAVYPAATPEQLRESLRIIFAKAAAQACLINLDSAPMDSSMISVQIQTQTIQRTVNGQGDWSFVPGTHDQTIEVRGAACQMIQTLPQGLSLIDVWQDGPCPPGG
jgi:hypothetical protein